jgi:hypothetical protein
MKPSIFPQNLETLKGKNWEKFELHSYKQKCNKKLGHGKPSRTQKQNSLHTFTATNRNATQNWAMGSLAEPRNKTVYIHSQLPTGMQQK